MFTRKRLKELITQKNITDLRQATKRDNFMGHGVGFFNEEA